MSFCCSQKAKSTAKKNNSVFVANVKLAELLATIITVELNVDELQIVVK